MADITAKECTGEVLSPITRKNNCSLVEVLQTSSLIDEWNNTFSIDVSRYFSGCDDVRLYVCDDTKLQFFTPANIAADGWLYSQLQSFPWFYIPWKWEHNELYARLKKGEKVMEIGCGFGSFVAKLHKEGYDVAGIELNPEAVATAAREKLPVYSLQTEELIEKHREEYDVVCSFQVLEHVTDPRKFISDCLDLLKTNARLVLCVPNNKSFLRYQHNILDMPPHHMTKWCDETFVALEKILQVKISYISYEPLAEYHVDGYVDANIGRIKNKLNIHRDWGFSLLGYLAKSLLATGLRRFCRGQSIYVELTKL